ncbi:hypothetical protein NV226_02410 [Mycoplasma iguanae]|uniref:Lipoprotein n=1 Tax=Mycoplasma iguanae TaxID=292461 RepID=A0ABY5R7V1_9MOLU|nr:hypothetical protein [Mycoplasma iguanae]UVD81558.1 hypothetical protein NV226_02410 [Mycoplasma iguanae]
MKKYLMLNALWVAPLITISCSSASKPVQEVSTPVKTAPVNDNPTSKPNLDNQSNLTNVSFDQKFSNIVKAKDNNDIYAINQKNQLVKWKNQNWEVIADNIAQNSPLLISKGRISAMDTNGNYVLIQGNKVLGSSVKIAPLSTFIHLGFASIVVAKEGNNYYLTRLESSGNSMTINSQNRTEKLLPDSKPIQVNLPSGNNDNGHITVLTTPDDSDQHSNLHIGDSINAKKILFIERHDMNDIWASISLDNNVFHENRIQSILINGKNYLVTVLTSKDSQMSKIILLERSGAELKIVSEGPEVAANLWMSFVVVNNSQLIVNHSPHANSVTFLYKFDNNLKITTEKVSSEITTYLADSFHTNISSFDEKNFYAPNFQDKTILTAINLNDKTSKTIKIPHNIKNIIALNNSKNEVLVLDEDQNIYKLKFF